MKCYIELENDRQYIVDAPGVDVAIAFLWFARLEPLVDWSDTQLGWVRWSLFDVHPEYFIHDGRRDAGGYVHSRCAVPYLDSDLCRLVVRALADQFDIDFVKNFCKES